MFLFILTDTQTQDSLKHFFKNRDHQGFTYQLDNVSTLLYVQKVINSSVTNTHSYNSGPAAF